MMRYAVLYLVTILLLAIVIKLIDKGEEFEDCLKLSVLLSSVLAFIVMFIYLCIISW